jgi:hypothetical protein
MLRSQIFLDVSESIAYIHICKAEMDHPQKRNRTAEIKATVNLRL